MRQVFRKKAVNPNAQIELILGQYNLRRYA